MPVSRRESQSDARSLPVLSGCTVTTRNHLARARVLAESFLQYEPGGRFYVLVVDPPSSGSPFSSMEMPAGSVLVTPSGLALADFWGMCLRYQAFELCMSLKPTLLRYVMDRCGEDRVVYLDSDVLLFRPLDELRHSLEDAAILLTPHLTVRPPDDGDHLTERVVLRAGSVNAGVIAARRSPEATEVLDWWASKLRRHCRVDSAGALFGDQKWLDLVPGMFDAVRLLRDDTYNVGHWNISTRTIDVCNGVYTVNGRPLAVFHFSGFDPLHPESLSAHSSLPTPQSVPALGDLLRSYAGRLLAHGFAEASRWPYGYARPAASAEMRRIMSNLYDELRGERRQKLDRQIEESGLDAFFEWATAPDTHAGLSGFLRAIYAERGDLRATYPDIDGLDRDAYLTWARLHGAREYDYDPSLIGRAPLMQDARWVVSEPMRSLGAAMRRLMRASPALLRSASASWRRRGGPL
jgi:hypothetical protein